MDFEKKYLSAHITCPT